MTQRNKPRDAGCLPDRHRKKTFHVVVLDGTGSQSSALHSAGHAAAVLRARSADRDWDEACPGSQWLARKLKAFGHTVRIVPPSS